MRLPLILLLMIGCRTLPPLPPVNLQEPGWAVRHGQAVWRSARKAPDIAGELLVATHPDGRSLVQFTKTPFPLVVAQTFAGAWRIEFVPQRRAISGRGEPPKHLIWFQIPGCLAGKLARPPWSLQELSEQGWQLKNDLSGETLECYLFP